MEWKKNGVMHNESGDDDYDDEDEVEDELVRVKRDDIMTVT